MRRSLRYHPGAHIQISRAPNQTLQQNFLSIMCPHSKLRGGHNYNRNKTLPGAYQKQNERSTIIWRITSQNRGCPQPYSELLGADQTFKTRTPLHCSPGLKVHQRRSPQPERPLWRLTKLWMDLLLRTKWGPALKPQGRSGPESKL
jgi:hypothetical protein